MLEKKTLSKSIVQLILIIDDIESSNIQNLTIDFVMMQMIMHNVFYHWHCNYHCLHIHHKLQQLNQLHIHYKLQQIIK